MVNDTDTTHSSPSDITPLKSSLIMEGTRLMELPNQRPKEVRFSGIDPINQPQHSSHHTSAVTLDHDNSLDKCNELITKLQVLCCVEANGYN